MTPAERQKRAEKAQMQVIFRVPFFAPGVTRLPIVFTEAVPTAATDGKVIYWNPAFFDWLEDPVLVTVLCHEVCHCMLGHIWRRPVGAHMRLWNIAIDHATNLMLLDWAKIVTGQGKKDPFPFPQPAACYCADPRFNGMAEEPIYFKLLSEQPPNPPKMPQDGFGGYIVASPPPSASPGKDGAQGYGEYRPPAGAADHSMPLFGEILAGSPLDSGIDPKLKSDWEGVLVQSCELARTFGSLPGNLERFLSGLIKPVVPWTDLLKSFLREQCSDDWSFSTPALEMNESGFMLPSLKSEKMGSIVFGSDWSGSTFGALVEMFHVEKQSALDELRPGKLIDIGFDTRVVFEREYMPGDTIERKIVGGGGTSFKDFFRRCAELDPAPKCAVVLTDLEGEFPEPADYPAFPVLWVVFQEGCVAPFGEVIHAH
jgi:predicted metal-dependent peptidase